MPQKYLVLLIGLFALFQSQAGFSQRTEFANINKNLADEDGKRHGEWVFFYSRFNASGPVRSEEGTYEHGERIGKWRAYYFSGSLKSEVTYSNGKDIGRMISYYENGQVRENGFWNLDHWTGRYIYFYPNGQMMYDWTYDQNGKKHGSQLSFHESGALLQQENWINGVRDGMVFTYDESGNLKRQIRFSSGVAGSVEMISADTDRYDANGQPVAQVPDGENALFDKAGRLLLSGTFANGSLMEGFQYIYNEGGLFRVATIESGRVTTTREPNRTDRETSSGKYTSP